MTKRIQKLLLAIAALAALAVGGSTFAAAQNPAPSTPPAPKSAPAPEPVGGPDTDNIQSGDQTTPDASGAQAEPPGTEQSPASEQPGAPEAPDSESAPNDDGPGGHADEPGNASADHQFQGTE
jgi:hypothetical protein